MRLFKYWKKKQQTQQITSEKQEDSSQLTSPHFPLAQTP